MATDSAAERRDASDDIREEGPLVLEIRQGQAPESTVYSVAIQTNETDTFTDDRLGVTLGFTISALQTDVAGSNLEPETVLDLKYGDRIIHDNGHIPVTLPGPVAPLGEVILYNAEAQSG
jgi:hypothetical protein